MGEAKFVLSKRVLLDRVQRLKELGLKISYSYKTNREVGNVLQEISDVDFSVHAREEIDMVENKNQIWFFTQAESEKELGDLLKLGIVNFVVDNEIDLERILRAVEKVGVQINLSLRMKFQEHRIGSAKYFVYGMSSRKVNEIIREIENNPFIAKIGIHLHRKSQNTSEWEIKNELDDSLSKESFERLNFINFGGGLPIQYRCYTSKNLNYVFGKIVETKDWLEAKGIESWIEPGRFLAGPCIKLITEIIQVQGNNLVLNTTIYNCALDTMLTETRMLIEGELGDRDAGRNYLIKGNSPTRDDIFRYKIRLPDNRIKIGEKIVFLNAGAYNYTTDFFGYKKLKTEIVD